MSLREVNRSLQGGYSLAKSKSQSVLRTTSSRRLRSQRSYNSTTQQVNKCFIASKSTQESVSEYQNSVASLVSERTVTASSQVFSVEYQFKGISAPSSQY